MGGYKARGYRVTKEFETEGIELILLRKISGPVTQIQFIFDERGIH